jgi:hypothetical protein
LLQLQKESFVELALKTRLPDDISDLKSKAASERCRQFVEAVVDRVYDVAECIAEATKAAQAAQ